MTRINEGTDLTIADGIAVLTLNFPPANAMSPALMDGLYDGLTASLADNAVKAIVLICAGRTFIAGADLKSMGKSTPKVESFALQEEIENSSKPTIAAMHGTALDGGLETALTFHYRIAVPSAEMGLSEVHLGLLPGSGGTQRLPRIIGAEAALDLMITGRHISAGEALKTGLIDRLADEGNLRDDAIAYAQELLASGAKPQRVRDLEEKVAADRTGPDLFSRFRAVYAKKIDGLDAPQAIIRCVEAAVAGPWEKGLAVERAELQPLLNGPQSAALRYVFMAEGATQKIPGLDRDAATLPINKVGIIGAGTMGSGITMAFLAAGLRVTLVETSQDALDRGLGKIRETLFSRVSRGKLSQDKADAKLAALSGAVDLSALANSDLVIEAVFEEMDVKKELFAKLSSIVRADCILATNTSRLDVNEIASAATDPQRVLGLHFFSPAHVMRLLEVIRGSETSDTVLATAMLLGKKLQKIAVVSGVCPGFIGNRILGVRRLEAEAMMLEGVLPWEIDRVLTDFGFPMGPFAMADLAGLDLGWKGENDNVRSRLVTKGRRGQKTGAGFYDYDEKRNPSPSPVTLDIIADFASAAPGSKQLDDEAILNRLLLPMINEGAKILEEGIALRGSDIDMVWITGYGWPAHKGGPMFYADALGLEKIAGEMESLHGIAPAPLLKRLAGEGGKLSEFEG
jgi:3-hydroxyacyl-CoA dehydrogenase